MGLNGADTTANPKSPYLKVTSSDPEILEVDQRNAVFVGKKSGKVEIRISFSEATAIVQAFVIEPKDRSIGSSEAQRKNLSNGDQLKPDLLLAGARMSNPFRVH